MEEAASTSPTTAFRLQRNAGGIFARLRGLWGRRWFRWLSILGGGFIAFCAIFWFVFARDLPDAASLLE